nr:MAG TPA: Repressor protein CI [Caudoviricetes sp.]DAG60680.1 MAG TPA: Repressor protein CI [Bacteriophage sp.]DAQ38642.1 MAG TPA: Repressor protein CI [Caudoviricetes sp.]DAU48168.1 MAG TPA: Repressor protein CI [Bacteriophage sp.]
MFYKKFIELCNSRGVTPSYVGLQVGVSKSAVSGWKNGSSPRDTQLKKIIDYFGVDEDYFSEEDQETEKSPAPDKETEDFARYFAMLTPEHQQQIRSAMAELIKEQLQG